MNFQTIIEELDKLYEEEPKKVTEEEITEEDFESEALVEAAEDEEILIDDEPITDDEEAEVSEETEAELEDTEETTEVQAVLECAKCGALMLKSEAEVENSEDSDLVNIEEACQYCEESAGYKILGNLTPVENEAPLDEGICDRENKN